MSFESVHLPEPLGEKVSMTFLRNYSRCPRAGFLYAKHRGAMQSAAMVRGSAFHEVAARATTAMVENDEPTCPPELVKAILSEVLKEYPVLWEEHDFLRELVFRWATQWTIDPMAVIAVEQLVVWEVAGWQVRCRIDFAELHDGVCRIVDYKTTRAVPPMEEIARRRPDGSYATKDFQLVLYALAMAHGTFYDVDPQTGAEWVAEPESMVFGPSSAEGFCTELVLPAVEGRDGEMVCRDPSLTRLELAEYRESLLTLLERLARSQLEGDWPAVVSDRACSECPAPKECPIPAELRDFAGEINTVEQAATALERADRDADRLAAVRKEVKAFAKAQPSQEIRYGADKAMRFVYSESDRLADKDGLLSALETGEPHDRSDFFKVQGSINFKAVTLTEEEMRDGG